MLRDVPITSVEDIFADNDEGAIKAAISRDFRCSDLQSFADSGTGFYNTLWQRPYFPKNDVIEIAETGAKVGD